jgi:quercetin dioxygenase-like cupin family protein
VSYTVVDKETVELKNGIFRGVAGKLGVQAFSINQIELPPGGSGPEHEHSGDAQEEVYVPLRGEGTIRVDGEDVELRPGLFVFVTPESTRQLRAGDEGLAFVAVGAARE